MAFRFSPRVVTDGLIHYLDPANKKSYVSGNSTIFDLIGTNNGTLVGSPSLDGLSLSLNGSTDYIRLVTNFWDFDNGDPPFTVSIWFKATSGQVIFGVGNNANPLSATSYVPAMYLGGSTGYLYTSCFWGGSVTNQSVYSVDMRDELWHNCTVTYQSGTNGHKTYVDGNLVAELTKNQTSFTGTYYYALGLTRCDGTWADNAGSDYFDGNLGTFMFYNRALNATEVLQNYKASRGRI